MPAWGSPTQLAKVAAIEECTMKRSPTTVFGSASVARGCGAPDQLKERYADLLSSTMALATAGEQGGRSLEQAVPGWCQPTHFGR